MKTDFDDQIILSFSKNTKNNILMDYAFGEATPFRFEKYEPKTIPATVLKQKYSGHYYCKTLGIGHKIYVENGSLKVTNVKTDTITLQPIANEIFSGDQWYMGSIAFVLDENKRVKGFYVRNDAIRNLWFERL